MKSKKTDEEKLLNKVRRYTYPDLKETSLGDEALSDCLNSIPSADIYHTTTEMIRLHPATSRENKPDN